MSFNAVATATSIAGIVLGIGWLFFGTLVLRRRGVEPNANALLVGRRLGVAYLGIGVMLARGALHRRQGYGKRYVWVCYWQWSGWQHLARSSSRRAALTRAFW